MTLSNLSLLASTACLRQRGCALTHAAHRGKPWHEGPEAGGGPRKLAGAESGRQMLEDAGLRWRGEAQLARGGAQGHPPSPPRSPRLPRTLSTPPAAPPPLTVASPSRPCPTASPPSRHGAALPAIATALPATSTALPVLGKARGRCQPVREPRSPMDIGNDPQSHITPPRTPSLPALTLLPRLCPAHRRAREAWLRPASQWERAVGGAGGVRQR